MTAAASTAVKSGGSSEQTAGSLRTLTPADVDAVALRVVELLRADGVAPGELVDAAVVARHLGVSRETVYAHADELGVVRPLGGARPRLRFDLEWALSAWTARLAGAQSQGAERAVVEPIRRGRPRSGSGASADLLPIRGERAA